VGDCIGICMGSVGVGISDTGLTGVVWTLFVVLYNAIAIQTTISINAEKMMIPILVFLSIYIYINIKYFYL
jgi:hypothetical protein